MIIDVEGALKDYFTTKMDDVVGHGNGTIEIHRNHFPDDSQIEGIAIYAELRESHSNVPELEPCAVRIHVRTTDKEHTFILTQNVDDLLDKIYRRNLNSTVQLCQCKRNAGPNFFTGENDGFEYGSIFYTMVVRYRGNDA